MLLSTNHILSLLVNAKDGGIGRAIDCYFNDQTWKYDYLVVDTGTLISGRKVLIAPQDITGVEVIAVTVNLTKDKIKQSPDISHALPISRQHEHDLRFYYGWPVEENLEKKDKTEVSEEESHLRSYNELHGYHIQAEDGEIGHCDDCIVDDELWRARYVVVDTANWRPAKKVLISTEWIDNIDWKNKKICIDLTREQIKDSPEYKPDEPINRVYEKRLYDYYGRPKYWENVPERHGVNE
ncbi:MAG: PRC-barrel domain containing protein [Chitinivibrionales bacterium]|nr:PRC-barrel domain containing protein [Chitinivibrionales bacterium]